MLVIFFGLAGVGKTYAGNVAASHYGCYHQDGDEWLTQDMLEVIATNGSFTEEMIDEFTEVIIANISKLFKDGRKDIVISQALYRQHNRKRILQAFPDVIFIQVDADQDVIHQRLLSRGNEVDPEFAATMINDFQIMPEAFVLYNNSDGEGDIVSALDSFDVFVSDEG